MSVKFPSEIMIGPFEILKEACKDRLDYTDPALHAVLMNTFGSVLGRNCFLQDDPPVYPNLYSVIVGGTGSGKTNVTKIGKYIMKTADQNVVRQTALATPEGLINLFVFPNRLYPGCNPDDAEGVDGDYAAWFNELDDKHRKGLGRWVETFDDKHRNLRDMVEESGPEEGFRVQLWCNEFSDVLKKSTGQNGKGMIETLNLLYDMEDVVTSPTKEKPTMAFFPCLSIIATTTPTALELDMDFSNIGAGFINRFGFYISEVDPEFVEMQYYPKQIDNNLINEVAKWVNKCRVNHRQQTPYSIDDNAKAYANEWVQPKLSILKDYPVHVAESTRRYGLHQKEYSLMYAAIMNEAEDNAVHLSDVEIGCRLADYHFEAALDLFGDMQFTEQGQLVSDIKRILSKKQYLHSGATVSVIHNRLGNKYDPIQIKEACEKLLGTIFDGWQGQKASYFKIKAVEDINEYNQLKDINQIKDVDPEEL